MIQNITLVSPLAALTTPTHYTIAPLTGFQSQLEACVVLTTDSIGNLPQSL